MGEGSKKYEPVCRGSYKFGTACGNCAKCIEIIEGCETPTITLQLNLDEAKKLMACLIRTSAKGDNLDVGEEVEEKLFEFIKKHR